jgi:hypothetical protein
VSQLKSILPHFHAIPDPASGTAILFLGFSGNLIPPDLIGSLFSIFCSRNGYPDNGGRVFRGKSGTQEVAVIRARPGALIGFPNSSNVWDSADSLCLKIEKDFTVELVAKSAPEPSVWSSVEFMVRTVDDEELIEIFGNCDLPTWLRSILDAQLRCWHKYNPDAYFRFTPGPLNSEELERCIRTAPYHALARWKNELSTRPKDQITDCMRRSRSGAVAFCLERIRPSRREKRILRHTHDALKHALEKLTDDEIIKCSEGSPYLTLEAHSRISPVLMAEVFPRVIPQVRIPFECLPPGLEVHILESIAKFPSVWINHYGSLTKAMELLTVCLGICPDGETVGALLARMDPSGKKSFTEYIATRL